MGRVSTFPIVLTTAVAIALTFCSCTDDPPVTPPPPGEGDTLAVTLDSATTTTLTLRLTVNSAGEYRLDRDGATTWTGSITPPDTVIVDANLLPSTEYHYTLMHMVDGCPVSTSPVTTARTSDTSSHEFVWEVDTLFFKGTTQPVYFQAKAFYGTSASNVYMAGYTTAGPEYGIWRWDGYMWKNLRAGKSNGNIADIDGIDSNFVVFLSGDPGGAPPYTGIYSYDNGSYNSLPLPLGTRNRTCLHVVSRDEIYLGCVEGIQKYNGTGWEWLLDSTETTGNEFYPKYIHKHHDGIRECVSQRNASHEPTKYVRWQWKHGRFAAVDSFSVTEIGQGSIGFGYAIDGDSENAFAAGIGGTYKYASGQWEKIHDIPGAHIAGQKSNNLFVSLNWDEVWHFNGTGMINLWDKIHELVPEVRMVRAMAYIEDTFFLALDSKDGWESVVLMARQLKK